MKCLVPIPMEESVQHIILFHCSSVKIPTSFHIPLQGPKVARSFVSQCNLVSLDRIASSGIEFILAGSEMVGSACNSASFAKNEISLVV